MRENLNSESGIGSSKKNHVTNFIKKIVNDFSEMKSKLSKKNSPMKILTMGSPASTYIFDQKINEIYNGNYNVQKIKEFYTLGHLLSNYGDIKKYADTVKQNSDLYEFLSWDFEVGLWEKLKNFQPDLLVFDMFSDIYFGSFNFGEKTLITRNFRLTDSIPENTVLFNTKTTNYVEKLVEEVETFEKRVKKISPKTKLVFNSMRLPNHMSKDGVIQDEYDHDKYGLSEKKINGYNRNLGALERKLAEKGYDLLKFDQKNSAAEINFPSGENWYYLYNQNYYTDVQCQIEMIAQKYTLGPTIKTIDVNLDEDISQFKQDVVLLNIPNNRKNSMRVFERNIPARRVALALAGQDYVLHGNRGAAYRFVKRTELKSQFPIYEGVHYRIISPKESKKYFGNHLLVRMLSFGVHEKTSIFKRNFQFDFRNLKDSIAKNTYILEIGDINLIGGSFYTNTKNFPDYEQRIQELISKTAQKYNVSADNIVIYGASRGGTGAVLHGALGNYKFVGVDPVINDAQWYYPFDSHFVGGVREVDLTDKVSDALNNYSRPKDEGFILSTSNVGLTFSSHLRLPLSKFSLLDLGYHLFDHADFNGKTVPTQLSYINRLLIQNNLDVIKDYDDLPKGGAVLEVKNVAQGAINFEKLACFRIRLSDIKNSNKKLYNKAKKVIAAKYKDVGRDKKFLYFRAK